MQKKIVSTELPSLLICGSIIPNSDAAYLSQLRSTLIHSPSLAELRDGVAELPDLWSLLVAEEPLLQRVDAAPCLQSLSDWLIDGKPCALTAAGRSSRNTLQAVLTVLAHTLEYTSYLDSYVAKSHGEHESHDIHAAVLESVRHGGIQGLCVGLLSAIALACSKNKTEVARHGAIALRLALCVGAFVDLEETEASQSSVSLGARWSRGVGDESFQKVLDKYPQAYIGVRTDACSATLTVPKGAAASLLRELEEAGAVGKQIDIQGRFHHQQHYATFRRLAGLCATLPMLQFPHASRLLVPLRRNSDGDLVNDSKPLHEMALQCILVEQANWHTTVTRAVEAMARGLTWIRSDKKARVLSLGPVDCVPRSVLPLCHLQVIRPCAGEGWTYGYPEGAIAIIGASCRFPSADTLQDFWDTIRDGKTGGSLEATSHFDCAMFRKSPREAEYMDPQHRLALHLAYEALESGGHFSPSSAATDDIGCYLGMSSCDYEANVNSQAPTAFSFTGTARAFANGRISHFFGLSGPSMLVDTACSSSAAAVHTACKAIQAGECSMALAGGVNLTTPQARSHRNLAAASFLSPTGQCRPFDADADGYCRGEGGGFVLLKKLSSAVEDNDCILGVLAASAINNSKGTRSITLPSSDSQSRLYRDVLHKANMAPPQVSYVEAHGTGTKKGDPVESRSIRKVFGGRTRRGLPPLRLGSVKGNLGHGEAASGLAALVKVVLMLQHRLIPPQANFSALNPAISPLEEAGMEILTRLEPWIEPFRAALVNNYGASGTNVAMLVCQGPSTPPRQALQAKKTSRYPFLIAAHSAASLRQFCCRLLEVVDGQRDVLGENLVPSVAFCLAQRQNHSLGFRAVFSAGSVNELSNALALQSQQGPGSSRKAESNPRPVVLVFAGQTGRRPRIDEAIYLSSTLLRRHLNRCDRTMQSLGLRSLFPRIFGTETLHDLVDNHCMVFSIQYAVARSWIDAGLRVDVVVGHSLGQLTSLCVSDVLSLRDALRLISGRASLIQDRWGSERGCMLSVDADAATVQAIAQAMSGTDKTEIACYNSSDHHVVVGNTAAIAAFEEAAGPFGVSFKRLAVSHGFHSELMDCIMAEYQCLVQGLTLRRPNIPFEPCSKQPHSWESITPELIARQSREPVYFSDAIARIEQRLGPCVWLEAGSGSAGVTLARRALNGGHSGTPSSHLYLSARPDDSDPVTSLADATLSIWREGVRVQFWLYHASQRSCFEPLQLPPYQFERSQHWLEVPEKESELQSDNGLQPSLGAPSLISLEGNLQDMDAEVVEFSVNQHSEEYTTFVRGRTVFGHILAPASVYIEAAARALRLLPKHSSPGSASLAAVEVREVKLHAPFGLDLRKRLRLILRRQSSSRWHFAVESHWLSQDADPSPKLQVSGTVGLQEQGRSYLGPHRPLLHRLYDRCEQLAEDNSASVVRGTFCKKIVGRVASYDSSYFGIRSVTSKGLEAVGDVAVPSIAAEQSAGALLIPPAFDNFLLVAELHAASVGDLADDRTYICGGFDAIIPQACAGDVASLGEGPWRVFSSLDREDDKTVVGDIFVFAADSKALCLAVLGARFIQIPLLSLRKALQVLSQDGNATRDVSSTNLDGQIPPHAEGAPRAPALGICKGHEFQQTESINREAKGGLHLESLRARTPQSLCCGSVSSSSQLTPGEADKDMDSFNSSWETSPPSDGTSTRDSNQELVLFNLLKEHLGLSEEFSASTPLGAMGLDSLVAIQLSSDIEAIFGRRHGLTNLDENLSFSDLCLVVLSQDNSQQSSPSAALHMTANGSTSLGGPSEPDGRASLGPPGMENRETSQEPSGFIASSVSGFAHVKHETNLCARMTAFADFFTSVHQAQTSLVLAYILEAFSTLGCHLATVKEGDPLPSFSCAVLPKYEKLVRRFLEIVAEAGLISRPDPETPYCRTGKPLSLTSHASELYRRVMKDHPQYRPDHQLLHVTGSRLADCLSGRAGPLQLLFQDKASLQLLEDVYVKSPLFATGNELLRQFVDRLAALDRPRDGSDKLRILEIGAGTGATTRPVLDKLLASNVDFTYTFTDLSVALIAGARRKLEAEYGEQTVRSRMEFAPLDIEGPPPETMAYSYDVVISSNCIHATRNLRQSCGNIHSLLRRTGGMLCLLELTRPLGWLDCVFGLLDGWWRFDDGRKYALASEDEWEAKLRDAGFSSVDWTDDGSRESQQFRLIAAWR